MVTKVKRTQVTPAVRTSSGLCDVLFDELDNLRSGKSDFHRASSVAKLANQIIQTKQLEIIAADKLRLGARIKSVALNKPLALGSAP